MHTAIFLTLLAACGGPDDTDTDVFTGDDWYADAPAPTILWEQHYGLGARGAAALHGDVAWLPDDQGAFRMPDGASFASVGPFAGHTAPFGTPRVLGDVLIASDGGLVALDLAADPPTLLWEADGGLPLHVGALAIGRGATGLRGYDPRTGADAWVADIAGDPYDAEDGSVCVVAEDGTLALVAADTGEVAWSAPALDGDAVAHAPVGCGIRPDGRVVRWWFDGTGPPALNVQHVGADGAPEAAVTHADVVVAHAALLDDGTFVAGGQQSFLQLDTDFGVLAQADDRDVVAIDPSGTVLVRTPAMHVVTNGDGTPRWAADLYAENGGLPVAAALYGDTAIVVGQRDGLIPQDQWTHAIAAAP